MPLQPFQTFQKTQLQPPVGPSADSLCHPWFTTTNLSYRFRIFETSATALCSTTVTFIVWYIYIYMRVCVYIIHYIWCVSIKTICVQRICIYNTVIRYMMLYVHMYTVSYWKNPSRFKDSQQDSRTERTNGTAHTDSKQTTHVSKAMPWNQLKNRAT